MSLFLNIRKIGKTKHKFKAKITFLKINNDATQKGLCFKVKVQRGAHEIQAVSQPNRKGIAKFPNTEYSIPMTLFCDEDQKQLKYLQKEATIKAYECDESGEQKKRIGTKTIDLSEFANKGQLKMEIQIDGDKKIDNPKITLQLFLQRQEDDSKSVQTYSNNNDTRNDVDIDGDSNNNKKKDKDKVLQKNNEDKSPVSNNVSSQGKKAAQDDRMGKGDRKQTGKTQYVQPVKPKLRDISPVPVKKYEQEQKRKNQNEPSQTTSDKTQVKYTATAPKDQKQTADVKRTDKEESEVSELSNRKKSLQTQFNDGQSPEMQAFLLKKALREKQTECQSMKRQNESLRKTIDKMVEQASTAKQLQKRTGIEKEVQEMRKALTAKDIIIDNLTTNSKALTTRQQEYQKTIVRLRQELLSSKQKIADMKYRQAFMMQELFETANKEALEEASRFLSI